MYLFPYPWGQTAITAGYAIGETKPSEPSDTAPRAAFFIEKEASDGVESGQTGSRKSIVLAVVQ
jgi:hypothetical protein